MAYDGNTIRMVLPGGRPNNPTIIKVAAQDLERFKRENPGATEWQRPATEGDPNSWRPSAQAVASMSEYQGRRAANRAAPPPAEHPAETVQRPALSGLTTAELIAVAEHEGADLGDAKNNAQRIEAIQANREALDAAAAAAAAGQSSDADADADAEGQAEGAPEFDVMSRDELEEWASDNAVEFDENLSDDGLAEVLAKVYQDRQAEAAAADGAQA